MHTVRHLTAVIVSCHIAVQLMNDKYSMYVHVCTCACMKLNKLLVQQLCMFYQESFKDTSLEH